MHASERHPGPPNERQETRRQFGASLLGLAGRAAIVAVLLRGFLALRGGGAPPLGGRGALGILRPPGSLEEPGLLSHCIRCSRCADACEPQCIRFFGPEAGNLQGTPYIYSAERACNLCLACGSACPTGAILPIEKREDARMGVAEVDKRLCVSLNGTGVCGACHTICPLRNQAITQDLRNAPVVHADKCVGCGLCEEICIVRDRRAIQVKTDRLWPGLGNPEAAA
jgi:MauM/NapG family ferredoxin protein